MFLSIIEKTSMDENTVPESAQRPNVPEDNAVKCEPALVEPVEINDMQGIKTETECTTPGETYMNKMYSFQTEERFYMAAYTASAEGDFEANMGAFDGSVYSLTIVNTIEPPAIPEFPVAANGAVAAVSGAIAVISRTRLVRGSSSGSAGGGGV